MLNSPFEVFRSVLIFHQRTPDSKHRYIAFNNVLFFGGRVVLNQSREWVGGRGGVGNLIHVVHQHAVKILENTTMLNC